MGAAELKELKLGSDLVLYVSAPPHGSPLSSAAWVELTERAVAAWQDNCEKCALPAVAVEIWGEREPAPVRQDGLSVVRLRSGSWCPDKAQDQVECYDPARRAITRIYPDAAAATSAITSFREADIEINLIGLEQDAAHSPLSDRVLATLIHEVGHVWGLAHSCAASLDVSCQDATARGSAMYPDATESGRALVLVPSSADLVALRAKYPHLKAELSSRALMALMALMVMVATFKRRSKVHATHVRQGRK